MNLTSKKRPNNKSQGDINMEKKENIWKFYQNHLGYIDKEMKIIIESIRNEEVITKAPCLMKWEIENENRSHDVFGAIRIGIWGIGSRIFTP